MKTSQASLGLAIGATVLTALLSSCATVKSWQSDLFGSDQKKSTSYLAVESNTGRVLYSFNANQSRPIGMLANIATASVVLDWVAMRNINMDNMLIVPHMATRYTHTNLLSLRAGDRISIRDALYSILLWEDSTSAITLAYACGYTLNREDPMGSFLEQMNMLASSIGMNSTRFTEVHGAASSRSSAHDLALLAMYVDKNAAFKLISTQKSAVCTVIQSNSQVRQVNVRNTNRLLQTRSDVHGLKAARSRDADSCLIVTARQPSVKRADPKTGNIYTYPQNMVIVVLGMGAEQRYRAATSYLKDGWNTWEYWRRQPTYNKNEFVILPKE